MNTNPYQCLRIVTGLFFCFYFVFESATAQASLFQRITWSLGLSNIPQSKTDEVVGILEDQGESAERMHPKTLKKLTLALDDPLSLIKLSESSPLGVAESIIFFDRFDLHKDGNTLFTKLFFRKSGGKREELAFLEAIENWENFLDIVRVADQGGYSQITETDLEAGAINFTFQRLSDSGVSVPSSANSWQEQSLVTFFRDKFTIDHYTNSYFKLTLVQQDPYYHLIGNEVLSFLKNGTFSPPDLMRPKEFILRVWKDLIEETRISTGAGLSVRLSHHNTRSVFSGRIANAIVECNRSRISKESDPFLKAIMEAAREDNRLIQVVNVLFSESRRTDSRGVRRNVEDAIFRAVFRNR